jgi:Na+-transporting methylmalonyl-CoA/oxaloacetate decarboxylase gamma subunit
MLLFILVMVIQGISYMEQHFYAPGDKPPSQRSFIQTMNYFVVFFVSFNEYS